VNSTVFFVRSSEELPYYSAGYLRRGCTESSYTSILGVAVSEAVKVPKPREGTRLGHGMQGPPPILPDLDEGHADVSTINKWIALADIALRKTKDRDAA
jgi:hypothetical protein